MIAMAIVFGLLYLGSVATIVLTLVCGAIAGIKKSV